MEYNRYSVLKHIAEVAIYFIILGVALLLVNKFVFNASWPLHYLAIPIMFFLFDLVLVFLLRAKASMTPINRFNLFKIVRVMAMIGLIIYLLKFYQLDKIPLAIAFMLFYFLYLFVEVRTYRRFGCE